MIDALDTLKKYIEDGGRVWEVLDITFSDGTQKTLQNEIMGENCTFSDCAESSSFPIGQVIGKTMAFELDNTEDQWKDYNFYGARIHATIRAYMPEEVSGYSELLDKSFSVILDCDGETIFTTKSGVEGTIQFINKGDYTVTTPEQYGEIISITAIDDTYKANAKYTSALALPQTAINILRDICKTLGLTLGFTEMSHGGVIISDIPEDATYRQIVGYIAMLDSANARIDVNGQLQFIKWDFSGEKIELLNYIDQPTFSSDDIVITGIRLKNSSNETMYGNSGYVLELKNDIVSDTDIETVAALIGDSLIGARFRSMQGELAYNPFLEFGDIVYSYDRNMNKYLTPITDISVTVNGSTAIKTQADDPIRGQSSYASGDNEAIATAKKLIKKETTERQKAIEQLSNTLKASSGLYMTRKQLDDGSYIYYMHDRINLSESTIIWKLTQNAFAISTDGGKNYPYGFTIDGELVTKLLYSEGINADYITAGEFTVSDGNGKTIFSANKDTGSVTLDASSVIIGNSSIVQKIEDLQNQTDGNIQTWTSSDVPTLDNYPASQWLTDSEKSTHVGDIYYDDYNHAYRFRYGTDGYEWKLLKDTDVTKAMQDASEAKEEASSAKKIASLAKNMTMQLTNTYQGIPVDSNGNYTTFPECKTSPIIMYGSEDITDSCTITVTASDGIIGAWNESNRQYTVSGLSTDSGWIDFRATYIGTLAVTKRFSVAKQYAGANGENGTPGRTYYIQAAPNVFKKGTDNAITPAFVDASSYYRDGNGEPMSYSGRWKVQKSKDGKEWVDYITTSVDSSSIHIALGAKVEESFIRIVLYSSGGTNVTLDVQDIPILTDVSSLTQEEIVSILSDNGKWKGLYYLNGELYISFNSALGGLLSLGGVNNGNGTLKIVDTSGNEIGTIDNTGVNFQKGSIRGSKFVTGNDSGTQRIEINSSKESFYIDTYNEKNVLSKGVYAGCVTPVKEEGGIDSEWNVVDGEVPGIGIEASYFFTLKLDESDIFHVDRSQTKIDNSAIIKSLSVTQNIIANRNVTVAKNLSVSGTKNRSVETKNYGTKLLHSYEMPAPMFGDCGNGQLNESGEDIVPIDDFLLEAINSRIEYQVFLQKEGPGDIWIETKSELFFTVKGTPNLSYSWELKAMQKDYEYVRWYGDMDNESDGVVEQYDTQVAKLQEEEIRNADKAIEKILIDMESGLKNENGKNDIYH